MTEAQELARRLGRKGIRDPRVLEAIGRVPRHRYVPKRLRNLAYADRALPIGDEQTISQPFVVAHMSQMLGLRSDSRVLEVGTGSGYQTAVLAELSGHVYTLEIVRSLGTAAARLLREMGYNNITSRIGDGGEGWPTEAPFDSIIVTAAPQVIPERLIDQLALGGRLVLPVGDVTQHLILVERGESGVQITQDLAVLFVPMTGRILGE